MACPGHRRPWSPEDLDKLKQWAGKVPTYLIARELGRSRNAIRMKAEDLGLRMRVPGYSGNWVYQFQWPADLKGDVQ